MQLLASLKNLRFSRILKMPLFPLISGIFLVAILIGFNDEYKKVEAFVRFLCLSCIGLE